MAANDATSALAPHWRGLRVALGALDDALASPSAEQCTPGGPPCDACAAATNAATAVEHMLQAVGAVAEVDPGSRASAALEAVGNLQEHIDTLRGACAALSTTQAPHRTHMMALNITSCERPPHGQPPPIEELQHLQQLGYTRLDIAGYYQVSESTAKRWCTAAGLRKRRRSQIDDATLSALVANVRAGIGSNWGWRIVMGNLLSRGYDVTQARLRALMPSRPLRAVRSVRVKQYKVRGPNALWHVDGNHKLKEWGFYIHGCIDGGTSFVHYLRLSDRNTAEVALEPFKEACEKYQGCSRVRLDAGSENVDIARFQLNVRGTDRGSVLVGPSVHNQRIERLWRDVRESVLDRFRALFSVMRNDLYIWEDSSTLDRHSLFWVFKGVIQSSLDVYREAWNNHHIPHRGTPQKLYAPCLRWEQVDDATMEELRTSGQYTVVVRGMADMISATRHWTQYSTDPVVSGLVPGFSCDDASAVYGAVAGEIGDLTPYSTDAHMTQFYSVYRQVANDLKPSQDWPVFLSGQ